MSKMTFMGAGSTMFAKNILGDSLLSPALRDWEYALYDIDSRRLEDSRIMLESLNANINQGRAIITAHLGVENRPQRPPRRQVRHQLHPGGRLRAQHRHRF